jgi:hypothetical protein
MARLTNENLDKVLSQLNDPDGLFNWETPRTAAQLDIACGMCAKETYSSPAMLKALQSPALDDLSDPAAILSYRRILSTFADRDVRTAAWRKLEELILRVAEPRNQCMEALFSIVVDEEVRSPATSRFAQLARPDDVPRLLRHLDSAIPPNDTTSPVLSNILLPRIYCVVAAIGAAGDRSAVKPLLAYWKRHHQAWWRSKLSDHVARALVEIGRRARDLSILEEAECVILADYPTGALDFAIGAARVECGDIARGVEQMIWRLDRSRSIEPSERFAPEALIKAGISHFDVLAPYLDEPRLAAQAGMIVERVLERAAGALSNAQLQAISARTQLIGIQVWWDTSKDVYEVSREERVPLDFTRCRDLAAAELARRNATRQVAAPR